MSESIFDDAAMQRAARANFNRRISGVPLADPKGGPREQIASGLYLRTIQIDHKLIHAASTSDYLKAVRGAKHSDDVAAAHRPNAVCGVRVFIDPFTSLKVWFPDGDSCPACVEGVLEPEKAENAETP